MKLPFLLLPPLAASLAVSLAADFTVFPDKPKQTIKGIGFEIQSDSIGSGNHGLPEEPLGVPHDLVPSERERLAKEMLRNFRYCRLAGGLYWRGLDSEKKFLKPRWPEQLEELKTLLDTAGVEGVCFEYWSPAPFWKGNQSYFALGGPDSKARNRLRCFAPGFGEDPVYKGDTTRFLSDFADAVVADIRTLKAAGIRTSMWGLQNEPNVNHSIYSSCEYVDSKSYVTAYRAVASAVRKLDPSILLFADTEGGFPKKIGPAMKDPEVASLVDAYAVHTVGAPSESVKRVHDSITTRLPARPWFQNEYEYLTGGATPDRCLNTVQHIMNSFQIGGNPVWFWIHCLKPIKNAEASGYSLGFWRSLVEKAGPATATSWRRWPEGPEFSQLPASLKNMEMVSARRGDPGKPGISYSFIVNRPVTVYLLAEDCAGLKLDSGWQKTALTAAWEGGRDIVFKHAFPAGSITIPAHNGMNGGRHGAPHAAFLEAAAPRELKVQVGINVPIEIRSEAIATERRTAKVQPGHWIFNPYNWNAVGSFVKHMPWDCVALQVEESKYDANGRILAFRKPNGKMTVVVSNRSTSERTFDIDSGFHIGTGILAWKGFRYTPGEAGEGTMGVAAGARSGPSLKLVLPAQSWEFWEQQ